MLDTDLSLFREYEPHELGADGYPALWHDGIPEPDPEDGTYGVKHQVRYEAGWRCERCGHPYPPGATVWEEVRSERDVGSIDPQLWEDSDAPDEVLEGAPEWVPGEGYKKRVHWSPCDGRCTHGDPVRGRREGGWAPGEALPLADSEDQVRRLALLGWEVQAAWRILTVHHLNGRKHDLRWWNLAALCQRCHLTIQRKVVMERVWPAEHTEWFKVHAAGWYGYAYLGENLTRAQALDRQDELLGLELAGA